MAVAFLASGSSLDWLLLELRCEWRIRLGWLFEKKKCGLIWDGRVPVFFSSCAYGLCRRLVLCVSSCHCYVLATVKFSATCDKNTKLQPLRRTTDFLTSARVLLRTPSWGWRIGLVEWLLCPGHSGFLGGASAYLPTLLPSPQCQSHQLGVGFRKCFIPLGLNVCSPFHFAERRCSDQLLQLLHVGAF